MDNEFNEWLIANLQKALNKIEDLYEIQGSHSDWAESVQDELTKRLYKAKCTACNGTGWYDSADKDGNNIKCGACDGTGREM